LAPTSFTSFCKPSVIIGKKKSSLITLYVGVY
jgi:hypothetical protein